MWKEAVPSEVWTCDNFLSESLLKSLLDSVRKSQVYELAPDHSIKAAFRKSQINPTLYNYNIHRDEIRKNYELVNFVYEKLSSLTKEKFNTTIENRNPKTIQFFLKSFYNSGFYDLHAEPRSQYGPLAFMCYLSDENSGDLVFPTKDEASLILSKDERQQIGLKESEQIFKNNKDPFYYIGSFRIKPKKNFCVVIRVGSVHYVEPINKEFGRLCLTGWPLATDRLLNNLEEHCHISTFFD